VDHGSSGNGPISNPSVKTAFRGNSKGGGVGGALSDEETDGLSEGAAPVEEGAPLGIFVGVVEGLLDGIVEGSSPVDDGLLLGMLDGNNEGE